MSTLAGGSQHVTSVSDLVDYMAGGCKPPDQWRIGTEHEKFGFFLKDFSPIPYDGDAGVRAILSGMQKEFHWQPIIENGLLIGLTAPASTAGGAISLEPGGQFELSGAMLKTLHQTCNEVHTHLHQVQTIAEKLGIGFIGLGFIPDTALSDIPVMPKDRYAIMRKYMATRGTLGLDMMFRSCTVQVNLDFDSEADMIRKFRVALALQPIVTAMFANSPFLEGKPNGYRSYRSHTWLDTDPDRTGLLPFAFKPEFGFERYVQYALDVPMYFIHRDDRYIDLTGYTFRDFLGGKCNGHRATIGDWINHLTTLFPEARLKTFLEMRGADAGPWRLLCALPALWVGLLYHRPSLDAAADLVADWSEEERQALRRDVPKTALATPFRGGDVRAIAETILTLARDGLRHRAITDGAGADETIFLREIEDIVASGETLADNLLRKYHGEWGGRVDPVFAEYAY